MTALLKLVTVLLHIALHSRTPAKLLGSANNSKAIRGRANSSSLVPNHHGFHRDRRLRQRENPAQGGACKKPSKTRCSCPERVFLKCLCRSAIYFVLFLAIGAHSTLDGAMLREKFDAVDDNSGNERFATLKDHPEPAGNWHHRV